MYVIQGLFKEGEYFYFYERSIPTPAIQQRKETVRAHIGIIGGVLIHTPNDLYKTNITALMQTDLGGLLPKVVKSRYRHFAHFKFYNHSEVSFHVLSFWKNLEKKLSERNKTWSPKDVIARAEHRVSFGDSASSSISQLRISSPTLQSSVEYSITGSSNSSNSSDGMLYFLNVF
jgi:hypothetical protein